MSKHTDFLYARPSFAEGVARIMDFGNTLNEYNESVSGKTADFRALKSDWETIGEDMKRAVRIIHEQTRKEEKRCKT